MQKRKHSKSEDAKRAAKRSKAVKSTLAEESPVHEAEPVPDLVPTTQLQDAADDINPDPDELEIQVNIPVSSERQQN